MRRPPVIAAGLLALGLTASCSGNSAAPKAAASVPTSMPSAEELCKQGAGATYLNSQAATVGEVRELKIGPGGQPARNAFPGSSEADNAAWCWTGAPGNYELVAVGPDGSTVSVEGLRGDAFQTTPDPGPAPIP